ncbi:MAG TPA: hypothetical protein DDY32_06005 [Desulfobulbaceae bacterium]|nr:hypothetical protein [Desulfobulbaceae bacterium]
MNTAKNSLTLLPGGKTPTQMRMFANKRPDPVAYDPPEHLGEESRAFWQQVCGCFCLEPHHLKILESACTCWDRIVTARDEIASSGVFIKDRYGQIKTNPAIRVEHDGKILLARLLRELQLDVELPDDQRPPRMY